MTEVSGGFLWAPASAGPIAELKVLFPHSFLIFFHLVNAGFEFNKITKAGVVDCSGCHCLENLPDDRGAHCCPVYPHGHDDLLHSPGHESTWLAGAYSFEVTCRPSVSFNARSLLRQMTCTKQQWSMRGTWNSSSLKLLKP